MSNLKDAPFALTGAVTAKMVGDRPAFGKGIARVPVEGKLADQVPAKRKWHREPKEGTRQDGLSNQEAEVLRRFDAGRSKQKIIKDGDIHPAIVRRALQYTSEGNSISFNTMIRQGSRDLLSALKREGFA